MASLQHLMCPPHTSLHFLLRGNLNKHIDTVGRARLKTFHLFTGLCISFVTWFLSLLQPQILLRNLVLSVNVETNPTPPQCSQFPLSLCSHPRKLHGCICTHARREGNLGYLVLPVKLPEEGHAVSPLLKNGIFLLLHSKSAVRCWLKLHHQAVFSSSK